MEGERGSRRTHTTHSLHSLPLVLLGVLLQPKAWHQLLPVTLFVVLYSFLPHKVSAGGKGGGYEEVESLTFHPVCFLLGTSVYYLRVSNPKHGRRSRDDGDVSCFGGHFIVARCVLTFPLRKGWRGCSRRASCIAWARWCLLACCWARSPSPWAWRTSRASTILVGLLNQPSRALACP